MYGGLKNDHHVLYDKEGICTVTIEQTIPIRFIKSSRGTGLMTLRQPTDSKVPIPAGKDLIDERRRGWIFCPFMKVSSIMDDTFFVIPQVLLGR